MLASARLPHRRTWRVLVPIGQLADQPDLPALRHRIDDIGLVQKPSLEIPRFHSFRRLGEKGAAERQPADLLRRPFRQLFPLVQDQHAFARVRFVKKTAADQNRHSLFDQLTDDLPQLPAGERIDPDGRLVQEQQFGERTSVQARPSFCFIPPESCPASRF